MDHLPEEIDLTLGRLFSTEPRDKFDSARHYHDYVNGTGSFYDMSSRSMELDRIFGNIEPHPWSDTIFQKDIWERERAREEW